MGYSWDSKYNEEDGKTTLDKEDDAAYVIWGKSCRMPTNAQFEELCQECSWVWTSKLSSDGSHTYGYAVKSKTNDNVIFLPAGGKISTYVDNGEISEPYNDYDDEEGFYLSCSIAGYENYLEISGLQFWDGKIHVWDDFRRWEGCSIRPVAERAQDY